MSHSPQKQAGSKRYKDAWRAINLLIRSDGSWSGRERNTCYLNAGNGNYHDASFVSGLDFAGDGRSFVPFDIDRDGDLDLILKFRTAPQIRVLRNDSCRDGEACPPSTRGALSIHLSGSKSNRDAVGARAILETNQRHLMREVRSGSGFLSQRSRRLHFGFEDGEVPRALEIRWPGGQVQHIDGLPERGHFQVAEGTDELSPDAFSMPKEIAAESLNARETRGTWLVTPIEAPTFSLEGSNEPRRLSDYLGKKVLLNFWATWCPPCREELADLAANAKRFEDANVAIVAVSVDEPGERKKVKKFGADQALPFPVLFADERVVNAYTVLNRNLFDRQRDLAIPTSFLLDEKGLIQKVYAGATPSSVILADVNAGSGPALPFAGKWLLPMPERDFGAIATAMAERGLNEEARTYFEAALKTGGGGPDVYNNLATLLLKEGNLQRAEELLRQSLTFNPQQAEARINLGSLLLKHGDATQAIDALEAARKMQADDAFIHDAIGSALFQLGRTAEAENSYREAVRLEPASADYHYNLGSALATARRFDEALAAFEQSRGLGRNDSKLRTNLGILYMETGQPTKAISEFQQAVELDPDDFGNHVNLAMYYLQSGDPTKAQAAIENAKALSPDSPAPRFMEAQLLASKGQTGAAKEVLESLVAEFPTFESAREMLRQLTRR